MKITVVGWLTLAGVIAAIVLLVRALADKKPPWDGNENQPQLPAC
jgi:hypothetical protein